MGGLPRVAGPPPPHDERVQGCRWMEKRLTKSGFGRCTCRRTENGLTPCSDGPGRKSAVASGISVVLSVVYSFTVSRFGGGTGLAVLRIRNDSRPKCFPGSSRDVWLGRGCRRGWRARPRHSRGHSPNDAALAHRGPDGDGFHDDLHAALGHRRLAIIDRAGGSQPMANEDGSCWIVFNGEIYNHRRCGPSSMSAGHRFRTASDTEVILHAYEEFGPACVERLEGMFAFAIYDGRRRELCSRRATGSARSRSSTRVLDGVLHFASEIQALFASPRWNGDARSRRRSRVICRSATSSRRPPSTATSASSSRATGCAWQTAGSPRASTGTSTEFDTDTRLVSGDPAGSRRHAARCRPRAARERSAARRVSERRHRFRPGRVVHGRGARLAIGW